MSTRVTDILFDPETCIMTVVYNNCNSKSFSIQGCDDLTPEDEKPGDSPDPFPSDDIRCRVAIKLAEFVVEHRYIDFLNAATDGTMIGGGVILAGVVSSKLGFYGWGLDPYPDLYVYGVTVITTDDRDTILTDYNADNQAVFDAVAEALYCVLPGDGVITDAVREAWRTALNDIGTITYSRLAEFLGIYPLANLRDEAFQASLTVDEVDCEAFDCGDFSGLECADEYKDWDQVATNPTANWYGVNGSLDTSGWEGDTTEIGDVEFKATRGANQNWAGTGAANETIGVGVKRVFDPPCTVNRLFGTATKNHTGRVRRICVYRRYEDDVYVVLQNTNSTGIVNTVFNSGWEDDPIAVTEAMWLYISERNGAALNMTIATSQINTE